MLQAIALRDEHLHQLAPTGQARIERLSGVIGQGARGRADSLGEEGQDGGVDAIGLRELAGGTGEVPDLARVGDHDREMKAQGIDIDVAKL